MAASRHEQADLALLCACCLLLAGAASGGRVDVEDMLMMDRFRAWQAAYNRSYATAAERLRRFEVYRQNMELIEATNRRGLPYQLGETPFTDLTSEEFLATHTMPRLGLHASEAAAARHREQLITTRARWPRQRRRRSSPLELELELHDGRRRPRKRGLEEQGRGDASQVPRNLW